MPRTYLVRRILVRAGLHQLGALLRCIGKGAFCHFWLAFLVALYDLLDLKNNESTRAVDIGGV